MSFREARLDAEPAPDPRSGRTAFQRDRDRILYCTAFRRLAVITQVVSPHESALVHNRLTHVLKVAQIGRRLAERLIRDTDPDLILKLGGLDPDVVETSCLAHDLGHPPFGHVAEIELDALATKADLKDGFEGNAQSFRIVAALERRNDSSLGLNLTRASLAAILKYPWMRETQGAREKKWGAYRSEEAIFEFAASRRERFKRSLEAEIMDWADDIAYSVHDMQDFYLLGKIPLGRLSRDQEERKAFTKYALDKLKLVGADRARAEESAKALCGSFPVGEEYRGEPHHAIGIRAYGSEFIGKLVNATSLDETGLVVEKDSRIRVNLLKQLIWRYVIDDNSLVGQQEGQKCVIRGLFDIFYKATPNLFPVSFQEQAIETSLGTRERARVVLDLICSMTEQQAISTYHRLTGINLGALFPGNSL